MNAEKRRKVVILGAAGRDFHDFNLRFRSDPNSEVVAFTAAQIPNIEGRRYPPSLAGPLYPEGIPILPEDELEDIVRRRGVEEAVFSYSDLSHEEVMHLASRAIVAGADFRLLAAPSTQLRAARPVVAVCAVRTGCGKSQTARAAVAALQARGRRVVAVRHPMPYGDLAAQAVQRFARREDLARQRCTIEEREEYEPYIEAGAVVFAGVDYEAILTAAEAEADVIVWDGGNNDLPFFRPDLHIVVADALRPGHEARYHPGEANARAADAFIINKVDGAPAEDVEGLRASLRRLNPRASITEAASPVTLDDPEAVRGKRVLVVEDGPTLTHGGMPEGAGAVAARRAGAKELVDPRPYAVGSLAETFRRFPHLGPVLPAMGYGEAQVEDLRATIVAANAEVVVAGTPIDLGALLDLPRCVRARYALEVRAGPSLEELLDRL